MASQLPVAGIRSCNSDISAFGVVVIMVKLRRHRVIGHRKLSQRPANTIGFFGHVRQQRPLQQIEVTIAALRVTANNRPERLVPAQGEPPAYRPSPEGPPGHSSIDPSIFSETSASVPAAEDSENAKIQLA